MAGIFSPILSTDISSESPVAPVATPSVIGGVADAVSSGIDIFTKATKASGKSSGASPDVLSAFSKEIEKVEAIRAKRGDAAAALAEKKVAAAYAQSGIDLSDDAYSTAYESMTGRQWKYLGMSALERQRESLYESEEFRQAAYAAVGTLGGDATQDDIMAYAESTYARHQANLYSIARYDAGAKALWRAEGGSQKYQEVMDTFRSSRIGTLYTFAKNGGELTERDLVNYQAQVSSFAATLVRPDGITDAEWAPVQQKMELMVKEAERLREAYSLDTSSTYLKQILQQSAVRNSPDQISGAVFGLTAVSDEAATFAEMAGPYWRNRVELAAKMQKNNNIMLNSPLDPLTGTVADYTSQTPNSGPQDRFSIRPDDYSPELKKQMEEMSGQSTDDLMKRMDYASKGVTEMPDHLIGTQEGQIELARQIKDIGLGLSTARGGTFSTKFLRTVAPSNTEFWRKLDTLKEKRPDLYTSSTAILHAGLQQEKLLQEVDLQRREETLYGAKWDEATNKYILDKESLKSRNISLRFINEFEQVLNERYGGDLSAMAQANFDGISSDARTYVVAGAGWGGAGGVGRLQSVINRRVAVNTVNAAITRLRDGDFTGDAGTEINGRTPEAGTSTQDDIVDTASTIAADLAARRDELRTGGVLGMGGNPLLNDVNPEARGIRNNNPGNIKAGSYTDAKGATGDDGTFAVFPSMEDGVRVMEDLLFGEKSRYKDLTVEQAINRYAPASDNNHTQNYVAFIEGRGGIPKDTVLSEMSKEQRVAFLSSMIRFENGKVSGESGTDQIAGGAPNDPLVNGERAVPLPPSRPNPTAVGDTEYRAALEPYIEGNPLALYALMSIEKEYGNYGEVIKTDNNSKYAGTNVRGAFDPKTGNIWVGTTDLDTGDDWMRAMQSMAPITTVHELTHKAINRVLSEAQLTPNLQKLAEYDEKDDSHDSLIDPLDAYVWLKMNKGRELSEAEASARDRSFDRVDLSVAQALIDGKTHNMGFTAEAKYNFLKDVVPELEFAIADIMEREGFDPVLIEKATGGKYKKR